MPVAFCKPSLGKLRGKRRVVRCDDRVMSDDSATLEELEDANIVLVGRYRTYREAMEYGLVILSMNAAYWHLHKDQEHELYVEPELLSNVTSELQAYAKEQHEWQPSRHVVDDDKPASFYVPYVLTLLLIGSFILQNAYAPGYQDVGRMDSVALLRDGEWWRPVTALFLHGDIGHLLGNLIFGIWYGRLVNGGYGTWLGWLLILLSGVLGNAAVAHYHYPETHLSIGASTAVFGALGLLVAHGMVFQGRQGIAGLGQALVPLVAGGVLLGWTGGFGTPQVDGLAHAYGFLVGILVGLAASFLQRLNSAAP